MIFSKKDIQEVLPADVTGRSVAHPKRWLVAKMRDCFRNTSCEGAAGKIEFDNSADSLSQISLVKR